MSPDKIVMGSFGVACASLTVSMVTIAYDNLSKRGLDITSCMSLYAAVGYTVGSVMVIKSIMNNS
jgi:hypothetical protein